MARRPPHATREHLPLTTLIGHRFESAVLTRIRERRFAYLGFEDAQTASDETWTLSADPSCAVLAVVGEEGFACS